MERYINIVHEAPSGVPFSKPTRIALPSGDIVGCAHWPAAEFLAFGKALVAGAADPAIEVETGYTFDAETGTAAPIIAPRPLAELKAEKKAAIAKRRWEIETGGLMVGGILVDTDRESQALITGKQLYLDKRPEVDGVRWKAEAGFVIIPRADFEAMAIAVAEHVQASFDREGDLDEAVDAIADDAAPAIGLDALYAIDVQTFWPQPNA